MSEVLTNGIKVPNKGSRSWYNDMRGDLVKLDALIGSASSVTVNPIITSGIEIASINVNGTSYSLYQQDSDISVNIKPVSTNEELPILLSKSSEENTDTVDMSVGVTVNPSSNTVTATTFVGDLVGNATTATNATKATQDASGNVITTTYATKAENSLKANNSDLTSHTTNNNIHVTSSDKSNWNAKSNFSGSYTDLTNKPTLPTKVSDLTNDSGFINNTDNCVHLTGNESISGKKYFDSTGGYYSIVNRESSYDTGDTPTSNVYKAYPFVDKNNANLGALQYVSRTTGVRDLSLFIYANNGSTTYGVQINTNKEFTPISNNSYSLGTSSQWWNTAYITTVNASILNIPQNAIVLAFCSSAVNNGSTVAGSTLKVANGGTGGTFTATTETLTGTYRALNTVVANGVGMFVNIA